MIYYFYFHEIVFINQNLKITKKYFLENIDLFFGNIFILFDPKWA